MVLERLSVSITPSACQATTAQQARMTTCSAASASARARAGRRPRTVSIRMCRISFSPAAAPRKTAQMKAKVATSSTQTIGMPSR
jgi:hypothetical protein